MSAIYAAVQAAGGNAVWAIGDATAPAGPGRITSSALTWNNDAPHRAAPIDTIVRSTDGITTVLVKQGLTTQQDSDGDWIVTFQDAALVIGTWYQVTHHRTDVGTRGALGIEFLQATA